MAISKKVLMETAAKEEAKAQKDQERLEKDYKVL